MNENLPDTSNVDPLGLNNDEFFLGIHNDVVEDIFHLPAKIREIAANALSGVAQHPFGEYAKDLGVAIKAGRDSLFGPRP